ncbi:AAA family ATPase [Desulfobacterales bacterium HSG2]|nr:AAA family ATPase [Desulfobacterales bacterium HSG2]
MKIRKLHIKNCRIFQNVDLDLTDKDKTQNFIVIAGINGSGKTTLLKDVIYHTFQNVAMTANSLYHSDDIFDDVLMEVEYEGKEAVRIFQIDMHTLKSDFSEESIRFLLPKFKNVIFYEAGIADNKTAKETFVRFVDSLIYEKGRRSNEAYSVIQDILHSVFQDFDLQIEFRGLDRDREVLFRNSLAEKIKIEDLSGGEQELITKAFSLYLADIRDSIILTDEPESSLHPNWQNRIARIYQNFADKNNNQVILATHSPHIVSSVPKEQIRVLAKEGNTVRVIRDFTGSYGWRADKVLLEIFRTEGLRTPSVEEKLNHLHKMVFADQYETDEFRQLQSELEVAKRTSENEINK